jgi:hypothetical protein
VEPLLWGLKSHNALSSEITTDPEQLAAKAVRYLMAIVGFEEIEFYHESLVHQPRLQIYGHDLPYFSGRNPTSYNSTKFPETD